MKLLKSLLLVATFGIAATTRADLITYIYQPASWSAQLIVPTYGPNGGWGGQTDVDYPNAPKPIGMLIIDTANPGVAAPGSFFDPDGPNGR